MECVGFCGGMMVVEVLVGWRGIAEGVSGETYYSKLT